MKKRFPAKYEKMKEEDFCTYLPKLYKRYQINEIFYKRVNNWAKEVKENEKNNNFDENKENKPVEIPDKPNAVEIVEINQIVGERVNETVEEPILENVNIAEDEVVIEETQCQEITEIPAEESQYVDEAIPMKDNVEEITEKNQPIPEKSNIDIIMEIIEENPITKIESVENSCPMQIDQIIIQNFDEPINLVKVKHVNETTLMEVDEDSEEIRPIKIEQFSPYNDDVEEIKIPETLPHTIEDSFDINDYLNSNSQESQLGIKEKEAINALDFNEFSVLPSSFKRPPNIKEIGGCVISKHQYNPLDININKRPYNTHKSGSQMINSQSLSQCIDNDVSQQFLSPQCIENNVSQAALLNTDNSIFADSQLLLKSNNKVMKKPIILTNKLKQTKSLILAKLSKKSQGLKKRKIIKKLRKRKPIDLSDIHFLNDLLIILVKNGINQFSRKPEILMKIRSGLKTINLTHEEDIRIVTGLKKKEFCNFIDLIKKSPNFEYNHFRNVDTIGCSTIDRVLKLFLMTIPRFKSILLKLGNNGQDHFEVLECTNSIQSILPTQDSSMVLDAYVRLSIQNAKMNCISDIN